MEVIIHLLIIVLANTINLDLVSIIKYQAILSYVDLGRFAYQMIYHSEKLTIMIRLTLCTNM